MPRVGSADGDDPDPEREHQKASGRQIGAREPPDSECRHQTGSEDRGEGGDVFGRRGQPRTRQTQVGHPVAGAPQRLADRRRGGRGDGGLGVGKKIEAVPPLRRQRQDPPSGREQHRQDPPTPKSPGPPVCSGQDEHDSRAQQDVQGDACVDAAGREDREPGQCCGPPRRQLPQRSG